MASRLAEPLPATLVGLTFATGLVDAISYLGLGRVFTANMTGNVVLLGFGLAGASGLSVSASLVAIAAFCLGAFAGGRVATALAGRERRWTIVTLVGEAGLILAATLAAIGVDAGPASPRRDVIVALLGAAMGLRNASVRRLAFPDLTTTVLTMTLTGLASDPLRGDGRGPAARRLASVLAMLLGALAGAAAVLHGSLLLALVALLVLVTAILAAYAIRAAGAPTGPGPAAA